MRIPLIILTLTRLTYLNSRCVLRVAFCFIVYARAIFAYTSHLYFMTWCRVSQWQWVIHLDKFYPVSL